MGQSVCNSSVDSNLNIALRLHLMLQRFSFAEVQVVRSATQALRALDETTTLTMHNWELAEPFDLRLPLLNWGLEVTKGRYFSCLSIDDLVLPGAYVKLLSRLQLTRAALALGGTMTQPAHWWGDVVLPLTLPCAGADVGAKPTVFLLDRARVPRQEQVCKVGLPDREVIDFIQLSMRITRWIRNTNVIYSQCARFLRRNGPAAPFGRHSNFPPNLYR
jgi:hypothetical protein